MVNYYWPPKAGDKRGSSAREGPVTKRYRPSAASRALIRPMPMRSSARARSNLRTGGFIGIENKFYDTGINSTTVPQTTAGAEMDPAANVSCLNAIAQGDGESNRDGRQCKLTSIQVKGYVARGTSSDGADVAISPLVRVLIVWDKQTNGVQLNSEDVLQDAAFDDVNSLRNAQYMRRFQVLYDQTFELGPLTAGTDGANTISQAGPTKRFDFYKKINIPVNFTGTTADIANITDNSIHVMAIASGGSCTIGYQARVRFVG